jgi:hypothetical protein
MCNEYICELLLRVQLLKDVPIPLPQHKKEPPTRFGCQGSFVEVQHQIRLSTGVGWSFIVWAAWAMSVVVCSFAAGVWIRVAFEAIVVSYCAV